MIMERIVLFITLLLLPMVTSATTDQTVTIDQIEYRLIPKGVAEIIGSEILYDKDISIPSTIDYEGITYHVTSIADNAFKNCYMKSINLPNTITSIGNYAFQGCNRLMSVTFPSGLKSLGAYAFQNCAKLVSVTLPDGLTSIGDYTFNRCFKLESVTLPNSLTSIGNHAFSFCDLLTSINIPTKVTDIGACAFLNCGLLTSLELPDHLTMLKDGTFYGCSKLVSLNIPSSLNTIAAEVFCGNKITSFIVPHGLKSIERTSFRGCVDLASVYIPDLATWCNMYFGDDLFANPLYYAEHLYLGETELRNLVIPSGIPFIGNRAFCHFNGLRSAVISNDVTGIGEQSFEECENLDSVVIGEKVTAIARRAFAACGNLKDVFCLAEKVPSIDYSAFADSYPEYMTLHVPAKALAQYRTAVTWESFGKIVAIEDYSETTTQKCAVPTISYANGKLQLKCATEGASFITEIQDSDVAIYYKDEIDLGVSYTITAYAVANGYENSDVVTATLCWVDVEPTMEGFVEGVASVRAAPVILQSSGGIITVSGLQDDGQVAAYALDGTLIGRATTRNGSATISVHQFVSDSIVIVKVGERSVKVRVK